MGQIIGRISSGLITIGGWLLFGARLVLDLIGYSTAPEDITVAKTRLDQGLEYFLTIPWWALLGFALISTLWLMWVSWPRNREAKIEDRREETATTTAIETSTEPPIAEIVRGKVFRNEVVNIDGKHFIECDFYSCTIEYNGASVIGFDSCKFDPPMSFSSKNQHVTRAWILMQKLGFLNVLHADGKNVTPPASGVLKKAAKVEPREPQSPQDTE